MTTFTFKMAPRLNNLAFPVGYNGYAVLDVDHIIKTGIEQGVSRQATIDALNSLLSTY